MPRPALSVSVPRPCHESWDAMMPATGGRHCAACQKVVVDFTAMTDGQLLTHLAQASSSACGRFRPDQLGRALHPAAPASRWRAWLASVLALGGVLGAGRAAGQARSNYAGPLPEAVSPAASQTAATLAKAGTPVAPVSPGQPLVIRGIVTEATSGERLPGVSVLLAGTTQGTSTALDGSFELVLTEADTTGSLIISFIGYVSQTMPITRTRQAEPLQVALTADVKGLGEVVVVGGYHARPPWPWHPRALYNWTRYRVGRLLGRY